MNERFAAMTLLCPLSAHFHTNNTDNFRCLYECRIMLIFRGVFLDGICIDLSPSRGRGIKLSSCELYNSEGLHSFPYRSILDNKC